MTADFWGSPAGWTLLTIGQIVAVLVWILLSLAFLLLADRKIWASVMMRKGPNVVGPFGMFQSFADFGKFVLKEIVIPAGADKTVFLLAPLVSFILAFGAWVVSNINVGVLYLFAVSSLGVYGIIMGGWASNSKYPFLGALRSAAQMVSYEVSIGFVIVTVILLTGSLNLNVIVAHQAGWFWHWNVLGGGTLVDLPAALVMIPMFFIFFVSALAETNRPPFDLSEAESELVAGYQVEYSSTPYLLFMIAEYANIVLMCAMLAVMFFGGWNPGFPMDFAAHWNPKALSFFGFLVFFSKLLFFFFLFAMVKALVPRYRYDQLMRLGWKVFLPTSIVAVMLIAAWRMYGPGTAA
jgi:NADH-quinone oxidoreductase subunit H